MIPQEILSKVKCILDTAQGRVAEHDLCCKRLEEVCLDYGFDQVLIHVFLPLIKHVLIISKKNPVVEKFISFIVRCAVYEKFFVGDSVPFYICMIKFLIPYTMSKGESGDNDVPKALRFRSIQIIARIIGELDNDFEVDGEIWKLLAENVVCHLRDKIASIRIQSILALSRFQEISNKDFITLELIRLSSSDTNNEVRRIAINSLIPSIISLHTILDRRRDICPDIRECVYQIVSRCINIKQISIEQRIGLIEDGMNDLEGKVKVSCIEMLGCWFEQCDRDIINFLMFFDVKNSNEQIIKKAVYEMILNGILSVRRDQVLLWKNVCKCFREENALLERRNGDFVFNDQSADDTDSTADRIEQDECLVHENLECIPEVVTAWYLICSYLKEQSNNVEYFKKLLGELLPTVSELREAYNNFLMEEREEDRLYSIEKITKIAFFIDVNPNDGDYESFQRLISQMIRSPLINSHIFLSLVELINHFFKTKVTDYLIDAFSYVYGLMKDEGEGVQDESVGMEFTQKGTIDSHCHFNVVKCLSMSYILRLSKMEREEWILTRCLELMEQLYIYCSRDCILDGEVLNSIDMCLLSAFSGRSVELTKRAICTIFCHFLFFGYELVECRDFFLRLYERKELVLKRECLEKLFDVSMICKMFKADNCRMECRSGANSDLIDILGRKFEEELNISRGCQSMGFEAMIEFFKVQLLSKEESIRNTAIEGISKLLYCRYVFNVELLVYFFVALFGQLDAKDMHVQQVLTLFFPMFSFASQSNQKIIVDSFVPVVRLIMASKKTFLLSSADICTLLGFFAHLTDFHQIKKANPDLFLDESLNLHNRLAFLTLLEVLSAPKFKKLVLIFKYLNLSKVDPLNAKINYLIGKIINENFMDKITKNFLMKTANGFGKLEPLTEEQIDEMDRLSFETSVEQEKFFQVSSTPKRDQLWFILNGEWIATPCK